MVEQIKTSGLFNLDMRIFLTTVLLFTFITVIIGAIIYFTGFGSGSITVWIGLSLFMVFIQWYLGPIIIKWSTKAKDLPREQAPGIYEIVERLIVVAKIPMPKLYIVDSPNANAFAFGRTQKSAGIAIYSGLMNVLNKEEIEGVLAHEIAHIKHRDVIIMTLASVIPVMIYYGVLIFGGRDNRSGGFLVVWLGALASQFIGQLLVLWLSRSREYCADEFAAKATGKPDYLINALAKISYTSATKPSDSGGMIKAFYFANPSKNEANFSGEIVQLIKTGHPEKIAQAIENEKKHGGFEIISTHPLTYKRLGALLKVKKEMGA
ncbi:MAG: zinc metalloprotease HtpX [Candidatus Micrarchaeota archaeon]